MKRILLFTTIAIVLLTVNGFGQPRRKKSSYVLPEVDDEVLVTFRRKPQPKSSARKRTSPKKYANQEVSYRKRRIKKTRRN